MKIKLCFLMIPILVSCRKVDRDYYPNGNLKSEIELNYKGEINGTKTVYFQNMNVQSVEHYFNNIKNGKFITYFENGNTELILEYKRDKKDGILNAYYMDGKLKYTYAYVNDKINGYFREYFNNGNKKKIRLYENDSIQFYELYDSTGKFLLDFRRIEIECKDDTIKLGENFKANVELKGPKKGIVEYSAIDAIPTDLKVKEVFSKYLPIRDGKGYYEYSPNKIGSFKILGSIRINYDSLTYPRYYSFQKVFFVSQVK